MYFLIYSSYASRYLSDQELEQLLNQSREKNKLLGITGLLLYFNGQFIQLIEGEEDQIKSLYAIIKKDTRHQYVITLKERHAETRFFPDWNMAFRPVSSPEMTAIEGFRNFLTPGGSVERFRFQYL